MIAASAALALGGTLAVAASASAASIPLGSNTDTSNSSLYGLLNQSNTGLIQAQNLIVGANVLAGMSIGNPTPTVVDSSTYFQAPINDASSFTADPTHVTTIGADIAKPANADQLELAFCVFDVYPQQTSDTNQAHAISACTSDAGGIQTASTAQFPSKVVTPVTAAAGGWSSLSSLVGVATADPTDFPGGLFSVDGDVSVSSAATVTGVGQPTAYSATFGVSGAAAKGFVIPAGFTLTFPANFSVNVKLVSAEIQQSQLANPPSNMAIGTASVTSPEIAALVAGSKGVDNTAQVFVVATQSLTQPEFEIYLGQGDYILGTLSGVTFPLTVTFGEPVFNGNPTPLPVSSVSMSFPAATSPLQATSCTDLGTLTGTMTDSVTTLASTYFGDSTDSGAQAMTATPTVVTNQCSTTAAAKNTATGSAGGLTSGHPTLTLNVKAANAFSTETVGLPGGLKFVKSKDLAKEVSVSGAKIKSVKIAGGKLVIELKSKVKSDTIKTKKGLISESTGLMKQIKKHKVKKLAVTVHAGTAQIKASINA
jgi:hypothetical protein